MDAAIVSAMAAVFGSLVGGSATVATAWVTQRTLSKRELISAEIHARETLYGGSFAHAPNSLSTLLNAHWTSRRDCCPCMAAQSHSALRVHTVLVKSAQVLSDHRTILFAYKQHRSARNSRQLYEIRRLDLVRFCSVKGF